MTRTLLRFSLNGNKLAARKEDVEKIRSIDNITHLPFSSDGTIDIALIDNRMTYLFDLSACLGFGSSDRGKINSALILFGGNGTSGFGVEGDIDQISVTQSDLLPLPDCVKMDLIATCMSGGSKPVPVIDLTALHQRLQLKGPEKLEMGLRLPETDPEVVEPSSGYAIFTCCGYPFALSGQITETVQVQNQQIAKVPFAPRWIEGLMFGKSQVMPLIRLSDCRLEADLMRKLPMKLSADLVYGCYLDGDTVTLILNVAVMALSSGQLTDAGIQGAFAAAGASQPRISELPDVAAQQKSAKQIKSTEQIEPGTQAESAQLIKSAVQTESSVLTRAQESISITEACDQPQGQPEDRLETTQKTALGSEHANVSTLGNRDARERILEDEAEGKPLPENGAPEMAANAEKAAKGVEPSRKLRSRRKSVRYALFSLLFVCILGTGYFLRTGLSASGEREPSGKSEFESVKNESGIVFVPAHDDNRETSYLVNFPPDSPVIRPGERANLIKVAAFIERNPPERITIPGHTVRLGTEESCLILSKVRAEAVRDLLLAYSTLEERRITTRGAGASRPVADNSTPARMAENRRAEIHLGY